MAESAASVVLVSILLGTALSTVGASRTGQRTTNLRQQGHQLGQALMAEILQQPYADPVLLDDLKDDILINGQTVSVTLGPVVSETNGTRSGFNDVDDYEGWTESPPQYKDGTEMTWLSGWRRTVDIALVKADDVTSTRTYDEGAKRITVDVIYGNATIVSLVALRTLGPTPTEICCLTDGTALDMRANECTSISGTSGGAGTSTWNSSCSDFVTVTPVAHWKCDEGIGLFATDLQNLLIGTLNGTGWTTGQSGYALNFDGTNDLVQIPNDSRLVLTSQYTIALWIYKGSAIGLDNIIMKGTSAAINTTYLMRTNGDEIVFGFADGASKTVTTSSANLANNTWYHVAGTYDSSTGFIQIFVNGSVAGSGTVSGSPPSTSTAVRLGRSEAGDYFHGRMDDLRIYDAVLTDEQIADVMNGVL